MGDNTGFAWNDRYLLGHSSMDGTHREFVGLVDRMLTASDADLPAALDAFAVHAAAHFAQENQWMADDFPARDCHIDEHDKVLASVLEVQELVAQGELSIGRELAAALMDWFPEHADYMDSALARWLVWRAHSGAPIVFKRFKQPAVATAQ